MSGEILRVENLTITADLAGRRVALAENVAFSINRHCTTCLVGESGSGKSLTARAIMRLIDSPLHVGQAAHILLDGRDLMPLTEADMRRVRGAEIAMIFQEPMSFLNPVYSVGDQVAETLVWHTGLSRRAALDRTQELFRLVGIPSPERRIKQFPHELSGGMQQRVMIAMALACEPEVLIADEPTTALDVTIQAQILDLLRDLQQRLGMAILLITHDLGVVAEMATDIVVMYGGTVVETGAAGQVLENYRAVKLRFHHDDVSDDLKVVEAIRRAVGDRIEIMIDANQAGIEPGLTAHHTWGFHKTLAVARELEQLDVLWLEEPLPRYDYGGLARLRDRLDRIRIAGGEDNHGLHEFKLLIDRGCFDILQPDALLSEGIFQLRKVAAMAEAANLEIAPHTWGNGMGLLANLHLAVSTPNCSWLEFPHDPPSGFTAASRDQMLRETLSIDAQGYVAVPDRPGFGFILDEDRIAHHTVERFG